MLYPSFDQIQHAAYSRWERRGHHHGRHRDDWLAAEQALLFALNYQVVAHYALDGGARMVLGDPARPICRSCERTAPYATFRGPAPVVPEALGNATLFTSEECDECRASFGEEIEPALAGFVAAMRDLRGTGVRPGPRTRIPVAALKGLARIALAIMPRRALSSYEDATEWVGNPDHEFDAVLFGELGALLHLMASPTPRPWVALARRVDEEATVPYMLLFLGTSDLVLQVPVPLCACDEDLDGEPVIVPRVSSPAPLENVDEVVASLALTLAPSGARMPAFALS